METTYVLIADAHRARCYERQLPGHVLVEVADFVFPQTRSSAETDAGDWTGPADKGHGRTAHAGTQFEPRTEVPDKERANFAQQLATYLNAAVAEQRCHALALIATSPMLGDLKPLLAPAASKALRRTVAKDLTHYTGPELYERVSRALEWPD
ncbi:MAG: host attachment protein [Rhodoferax sp.]|nr:host attachment protein [Rhodoferax sp.]MDP3651869.1 host attachment protein [Rhodoferax sp.]